MIDYRQACWSWNALPCGLGVTSLPNCVRFLLKTVRIRLPGAPLRISGFSSWLFVARGLVQ